MQRVSRPSSLISSASSGGGAADAAQIQLAIAQEEAKDGPVPTVADEAERLASGRAVDQWLKQEDTKTAWKLTAAPATNAANWELMGFYEAPPTTPTATRAQAEDQTDDTVYAWTPRLAHHAAFQNNVDTRNYSDLMTADGYTFGQLPPAFNFDNWGKIQNATASFTGNTDNLGYPTQKLEDKSATAPAAFRFTIDNYVPGTHVLGAQMDGDNALGGTIVAYRVRLNSGGALKGYIDMFVNPITKEILTRVINGASAEDLITAGHRRERDNKDMFWLHMNLPHHIGGDVIDSLQLFIYPAWRNADGGTMSTLQSSAQGEVECSPVHIIPVGPGIDLDVLNKGLQVAETVGGPAVGTITIENGSELHFTPFGGTKIRL